ncbi:glycosyltransferase-like protein gnt15 [Chenopodium quinoa]|uniref:glycosyltransferase-like protein gnt15 n=1 Tax=Chenopodium quinoa TaxID=63459 RepID=UPI000B775E7C|nr:glycosyltransferase-like protein gnt15 [Chenopodium quinoa]
MVGRNNNNIDLNEVVRQLATVAQQLDERNNNNNTNPAGELFKKISQSKPPTYQGEPDPTILENWLREFDKLFVAVVCPNESKKADEFLELKIGSMSVTEYYTKFIELSRFAEDTVTTDRQKSRRFERGLPLSLQGKLSGKVFDSFDELYGRAVHLHALELKEKADLEAREKRKEPMTSSVPSRNQNNFKKQKFNHHQGNKFQNNRNNQGGHNFPRGNRNQSGDRNQRIYYCKRCSNNHPGTDYEGNLVTFNLCNKQGHKNQKKGGQGSNGNQVNKGAQFQSRNKNTNGGNTQVKGGTPGKFNVIGLREAEAARDVISGTLSTDSVLVKVLFDSGATYSFISKAIIPKLLHCPKTVDDIDIPIELLIGGVVHCTRIYKDVPIKIKGKEFMSNLIEFELGDLDIILGMDWLCRFNAEIRC